MTAPCPVAWRRLWRAMGLALDRLLPFVFTIPAPLLSELPPKVRRIVVVPGSGRQQLSEQDAAIVADAGAYVSHFVAEHLPAQVTVTDMKPHLPEAASRLAVRKVGSESEYLGSFDLLLRVSATQNSTWRRYHNREVALDVKLTGASGMLGLNGPTMRTNLEHARKVMIEARRQASSRVGQCAVVAFLVRRPPGQTFDGRRHAGSFGFVAVDVEVLVGWDPHTATQAPAVIVMTGALLQRANVEEESWSLRVAPPPARPPPRDRWSELTALCVRRGEVTVIDFCTVFQIGPGNLRKGAERVLKRLRAKNETVGDWQQTGGSGGRPFKTARVGALRREYPDLR